MTQYNSVNVKLSNSQLDKQKSAIKSETGVTLRLSSNRIDESNDETNYPHKLLPTENFQSFVKLLQRIHQLI